MSAPLATTPSALACPVCRNAMQALRLPRLPHGELTLDLCLSCEAIWFDEFESAQIAPAGVLDLFHHLHAQRDPLRQSWPERLHCPRCAERMLHGLDRTKHGHFSYFRCPEKHGRLTTFAGFFMEKGFVRQLNGTEIEALARQVQTVRCSGCGAPVDIRREHVCTHCRAPVVVLDEQAIDKALQRFHSAAARQAHPDPLAQADALLANERLNSAAERERKKSGLEVDLGELLLAGLGGLWRFLWHLLRR